MKVLSRKKTFATVTAGLARMVSDLRALADEQVAERERKTAEVSRLLDEVNAHDVERDRATNTARKIEELLA